MLVMDTPCVFMVSMVMIRSVFMSSTPVRATSMAMSPMWLSCNQRSMSPNPMASLRFVRLGRECVYVSCACSWIPKDILDYGVGHRVM